MYDECSVTNDQEIYLFFKMLSCSIIYCLKNPCSTPRFPETFSMWYRSISGTKWHRFHYCCNLWWVQPLYCINTLDYIPYQITSHYIHMLMPIHNHIHRQLYTHHMSHITHHTKHITNTYHIYISNMHIISCTSYHIVYHMVSYHVSQTIS